MRLFLGLPWPEEQKEELALRARVWEGRPALRPVAPSNWHVTLRFLGETPEDQVAPLSQLLLDWSKNKGPLTFVDRGWSVFGSYQAPRVVLLQLEAMPAVTKVVGALHKALDAAGFPGDGKPWKPHVTLAYGKGDDPGAWPAEVKGGRPPLVFKRVVLFGSTLGTEGSTYEELASVDLG